ncbi:ATP-binding cassette domain-containing protein [Microbacterium sp. 18062]|uniref:ATP-binding cassette domain-containing protein n=1 Tax=Microbacterium sp. 18062 TaxID=2681410 RepID=UPI0013583807|nr:ATP-binding cassette domain-containing protein [Microbacterium sp. 18062]
MSDRPSPLLDVRELRVDFRVRGSRTPFTALHDVSLDVRAGEAVGLVGESGSGKSTLGRAVLGLVEPSTGTIRLDGRDITRLRQRERRALASETQVVFQDPYGSLNPALRIGDILGEPLLLTRASSAAVRSVVLAALDRVHLPADAINRYAHEFSGGQRQRVAIARALIRGPRLIICDEALSALDLTTQARIIELLLELQADTGVAYLFISHDLAVVRHLCHRVAVLRHGRLVESGDGDRITSAPEDPYTRELLAASPVPDPVVQRARRLARGLPA